MLDNSLQIQYFSAYIASKGRQKQKRKGLRILNSVMKFNYM